MQQDSAFVLIAACGMGVICLGLVALLAVLALRFTGRTIGEFLGDVGGLGGVVGTVSGADDDEGDEFIRARSRGRRTAPPARDLRAQAQSLDFDSAVNRYRAGDNPPSVQSAPPPLSRPAPQQPPVPPLDPNPATDERAASLRRRRNQAEEIDGMLGGFLDDDDDGGLF